MNAKRKLEVVSNMLTANDPRVKPLGDVDYTGLILVVPASRLGERYQQPQFQLFKATGGFGCSPTASGRKVFGTELADGAECHRQRGDFIGYMDQADANAILAAKAQPKPIDVSLRCFMAVNLREMFFHKADTIAEACKLARGKFGCKHIKVFRVHPEAYVNDMCGISAPAGTTIEEIK